MLEHYKGHTEEARDFVARRQREKGGTSRCRNDPAIETYLLFGEQEKTIRTKTLEDVALECGCDAAVAVDLMRAMDQGQQVEQQGSNPCQGPVTHRRRRRTSRLRRPASPRRSQLGPTWRSSNLRTQMLQPL